MWLTPFLTWHPGLWAAFLVGDEQKEWGVQRVTSMSWGLARDFWFAFLMKGEQPCLCQTAPLHSSWRQDKVYLSSQATVSHSSKTAQAPSLPRRGKCITLLLLRINFLGRNYLTGVSRGCPGKSSEWVPARDSPHCFLSVSRACRSRSLSLAPR